VRAHVPHAVRWPRRGLAEPDHLVRQLSAKAHRPLHDVHGRSTGWKSRFTAWKAVSTDLAAAWSRFAGLDIVPLSALPISGCRAILPRASFHRVDDLTRAFYEQELKIACCERVGDAFQDLFSSIMEKRYPKGDFQRVRPWGREGDRKNDGYLRSGRKLFQCYAPNELKAAKLIAKIRDDFRGALPHWELYFDTWVFVHNGIRGVGPSVAKTLLEIEETKPPFKLESWAFNELLLIVRQLVDRDLVDLFGHAPSRRDVLALGLNDLIPVLDHLMRLPEVAPPDLRPVPHDKLLRNQLSGAVHKLLGAGMSRADLVPKYFRDRPAEQDRVADGFRKKYQALRSDERTPDDIFGALQRYAGGAEPAPMTQVAVLAVLAFFFETCDIFERPDPEQEST